MYFGKASISGSPMIRLLGRSSILANSDLGWAPLLLCFMCLSRWHSNRLNKDDIAARAYIQFKNLEQIAIFSKEYDGHVFRDKQGEFSGSPMFIV